MSEPLSDEFDEVRLARRRIGDGYHMAHRNAPIQDAIILLAEVDRLKALLASPGGGGEGNLAPYPATPAAEQRMESVALPGKMAMSEAMEAAVMGAASRAAGDVRRRPTIAEAVMKDCGACLWRARAGLGTRCPAHALATDPAAEPPEGKPAPDVKAALSWLWSAYGMCGAGRGDVRRAMLALGDGPNEDEPAAPEGGDPGDELEAALWEGGEAVAHLRRALAERLDPDRPPCASGCDHWSCMAARIVAGYDARHDAGAAVPVREVCGACGDTGAGMNRDGSSTGYACSVCSRGDACFNCHAEFGEGEPRTQVELCGDCRTELEVE